MSNTLKVIAALRGMKSGLLTSEIAERAHLKGAQVTSAITCLKLSNTVIAHAGESPNKTRYTLNPDLPDTAVPGKPAGKKSGRPVKTMRDIAVKHIHRSSQPSLAITHISTTFDVIMEIAEEDIDGMDPLLRSALNAHREAIELARSL